MLSRRRAGLLAVLLLGLAGTLWCLAGPGAVRECVELSGRATPERHAESGPLAPPREPATRAALGEAVRETGAAVVQEPGGAGGEPAGHGQLTGRLHSAAGAPLGGHTLVLARAAGARLTDKRRVRAEADGFYWVERLPVGPWVVCYLVEHEAVPEEVLRSLGAVVIEAGRTAVFDVFLDGERQVSGEVTIHIEGYDGIVLELELRSKWGPERVVGRGESVSYASAPWKGDPLPEGAEPRLGAGETDRPLRAGAFHFPGLEAEVLVLRIWLDRKHDLYLERDVDLTNSDAVLPAERLTLDDFVRAKLRREAGG